MLSRILSIFLVFTIGTTVFIGFLAIYFMSHNNHYFCPISSIMGSSCSSFGNIGTALHHLSGLKSFAQGVLNSDSLFLSALILIFAAALVFIKIEKDDSFEQFSFYNKYLKNNITKPESRILAWISLHNKRDPYSIYNRCTIFN